MKKVLNWFLSILGFLLLIGLMIISINDRVAFLPADFNGFISFIRTYGALIIVGLLVFVNILGKGIIRILLTILFIAVGAFYIFATAFPAQFVQLFGIA